MTPRNRSAYLRPLFDTAPEGVTNHTLQGVGLGLLHELVVHALVHERPRPGAAALALCGWESVSELRICSNDCSNTARWQYSWTRTWLKKTAWCASSTAWSTSASSMTTKGDLPPSSSVTGFRLLLAASSSTICPVPVDPVNASCTKNVQVVQGSDQRWPLKHHGKAGVELELGYLVNTHVATERGAGRRTEAGHHVQNTLGESSLQQ